MVLEEASLPSNDDGGFDVPPMSDADPYSSETSKLPFDPAVLTRPIPILGPLFGYTPDKMQKVIKFHHDAITKIVNRPLDPDEASAIAQHTSRGLALVSYGSPLGMAGGFYRAYNTRQTFRLPFWKPDLGKHNADEWLFLRGVQARAARHTLRFGAYGILGSWIGRWFMASYATAVTSVAELRDPRLAEVNQARIAQVRERRGVPPTREDQHPAQGRRPGSQTVGRSGDHDDASPTDGLADQDDMASLKGAGDGVLSDTQMHAQEEVQQQQQQQRASTSWPQGPSRAATTGFDEIADDSSPTTGSEAEERGDGSAWDRIRRGAGPTSSPSPSSSTPSFSVTNTGSTDQESAWPSNPSPQSAGLTDVWARAREAGMKDQGRKASSSQDQGHGDAGFHSDQ